MKNLKYSSMILIRIHWNIIIQDGTKIFWVLKAISHDHLDHGLSKIFSWIVRALFQGFHYNGLSPFTALPSSFPLSCLLPFSNHLIQSLLHHGVARLEIDANQSEVNPSSSQCTSVLVSFSEEMFNLSLGILLKSSPQILTKEDRLESIKFGCINLNRL